MDHMMGYLMCLQVIKSPVIKVIKSPVSVMHLSGSHDLSLANSDECFHGEA